MLSIIPAFLIFFSSFLQDPSGSWIRSSESASIVFYFKSKYLSKVDSKITIWIKQVPKNLEEQDGKKIAYALSLLECDCNNISYRRYSVVKYSENGDVIYSGDYKDPEISYNAPGSVGYGYIEDICQRFNKKKK